ncbi:Serine/threonine-protein kinase PrkC [Thalassocella blandensis]|nr:Serine/threonine-protein kinase PrkC [Thalassocella blandensis]
MQIENNTTLNQRYTLLHMLGYGGMGIVYLADDTRLNRKVAIKSIQQTHKNEKIFQDFIREAQFLAQLNHPNIVQIFDVLEVDGDVFLVMEFVQGQNLTELIKFHPHTRRQAIEWLLQIAEGLMAAHKAKIIHRDLKASNILINEDARVKIADFGIARSIDKTQSQHSGITGSLIALSPEQIRGEAVDHRSDIFSFAVLNYWVLFHCHPFGNTENAAQLIQNIVSGNLIEPQVLDVQTPEPLADLLQSSLRVDVHQRTSGLECFVEVYKALLSENSWQSYLAHLCESQSYTAQENGNNQQQRDWGHDNLMTTVMAKEGDTEHSLDSRVVTDIKKERNTQLAVETKRASGTKAKFELPKILRFPSQNRKFWMGIMSIFILTVAWLLIPGAINLSRLNISHFNISDFKLGTDAAPVYIKIVEPEVSMEATVGHKDRYQRLANNLRNAFEQFIIQSKGLYLLPRGELSVPHSVIELRTFLDCQSVRCDVSIETVSGQTQIVQQTKRWTALLGEFIESHKTAQRQLAGLMGVSDAVSEKYRTIEEASYPKFIDIYTQYLLGEDITPKLLQALEQLIAKNPYHAPLYELYCDIALYLYRSSGDHQWLENASARYQQASLHIAYTPDLYASQFELLLLEENTAKAHDVAELFLEKDGDPALYYSMISRIEMLAGQYEKAEHHMRKSLSYRETRNTYYDLVNLYWYRGDYPSALQALDQLFALDPQDYYGLRLQALIYLAAGELEKSIASYQQILQFQEESAVLSNLGTVYFLNRQYEKAQYYFSKVLEKENQNPVWMLNLADVEFYFGDKTLALDYYQKIIAFVTETETLLEFKLAIPQAYAHLDRDAEALKLMNDLLLAAPDNVNVLYTAALVHALAQEKLTALVYMEKSLEHGMGIVWFSLPMFENLCSEQRFLALLRQHSVAHPRFQSPCREALLNN